MSETHGHSGLSNEEYYARLPRKRIVAAVLTFFEGQLLIVKPTYQSHWLIPGGVVEAHESPLSGARREFEEEIGFKIEIEKLLLVDHTLKFEPFHDEALHFLFKGRDLTRDDLARIKLPPNELSEFACLPLDQAFALFSPYLAARVKTACEGEPRGVLSENGKLVP